MTGTFLLKSTDMGILSLKNGSYFFDDGGFLECGVVGPGYLDVCMASALCYGVYAHSTIQQQAAERFPCQMRCECLVDACEGLYCLQEQIVLLVGEDVEGVVASFQYFNADWEYYRGVFRVCLVPGLRYVVCAVLRYLDVFLLEVQQVYVGEAG